MNALMVSTHGLLSYLFFASITGVVLVSLAWVLIKLAKIKAPIYKHHAWLFCLISTVLLPLVCLFGPKLTLAILSPQPSETLAMQPIMPKALNTTTLVTDVPKKNVVFTQEVQTSVSAISVPQAQYPTFTIKSVLAMVWLVGAAFMSLRLVVGWFALRRICMSAEPVSETEHYHIRRVRILVTPHIDVPVCFGLLRGTILLQERCTNMPQARNWR